MPDTRGWQAIVVSALIKDRPPAPVRNTAGRGPALISTASDSRIAHSGARHLQDTDSGDSKLIFLAPVAGDSWAASARNLLSLASWSASAPRWGRQFNMPEVCAVGLGAHFAISGLRRRREATASAAAAGRGCCGPEGETRDRSIWPIIVRRLTSAARASQGDRASCIAPPSRTSHSCRFIVLDFETSPL